MWRASQSNAAAPKTIQELAQVWHGPLAPLAIALSKAKVLLAVFKLKFLFSLFAFLGFYWALFGMRFGIGFAVLILIHEMGHYVDIKRRGLAGGDAGIFAGLGSSRAMFTDDFQEELQVSDPTLGLILIGT